MVANSDTAVVAIKATDDPRRPEWLLPVACFAMGLLLALRPALLAGRFDADFVPALSVARGAGVALAGIGAGAFAWTFVVTDRARVLVQCAVSVFVYSSLVWILRDWHVDDAAITYAYSENLARGLGLVLHPRLAPEEAYSSTLWMLLLAGARFLGFDVATSAKVLSAVVGAASTSLVMLTSRRVLGRPLSGPAFAVALAAMASAPVVIWTASGLEHGLQGLVLVALVWATTDPDRTVERCSAGAAAFVLLRPEAPLVIAALVACLGARAYAHERTVRSVLRLWPVVLLPCLTLGALLVFRRSYFDDLWPNPYYVKVAGSATFLRVLNPFGGGWRYVTEFLTQGGGCVLLLPLLGFRRGELPLPILAAVSLLAGQLSFVVYAGGDWMQNWRFLAAPLALVALLSAYGVDRLAAQALPWVRRLAGLTVAVLVLSNVPLLVAFRARPTTPYATVSAIGETFVEVAARMSIPEPVLAHHDAGGTSYRARIQVLDLCGLGDRVIAKHHHDAAFLRRYILEERRPDFIFGTESRFAAATAGIRQAPAFQRDYVRLEVPGRPYMKSDLCHVRRDRVLEAEGVRFGRAADGSEIVRVDLSGGLPG